jgi:hypothetical protein
MALPACAAVTFNDCTWLLFGATANYAVISDGSICMTMTAGGEGVIHLGPSGAGPPASASPICARPPEQLRQLGPQTSPRRPRIARFLQISCNSRISFGAEACILSR